jgi:hypothetical protein
VWKQGVQPAIVGQLLVVQRGTGLSVCAWYPSSLLVLEVAGCYAWSCRGHVYKDGEYKSSKAFVFTVYIENIQALTHKKLITFQNNYPWVLSRCLQFEKPEENYSRQQNSLACFPMQCRNVKDREQGVAFYFAVNFYDLFACCTQCCPTEGNF